MGPFSIFITVSAIILGIVSKKSRLVTYLLLSLLFILITFEYTQLGDGDYYQYENIYEGICEGSEWAWISYEPLFVFLLFCCGKLGLSLIGVKCVVAIVSISLLYSSIKRYTSYCALPLALFFIYPVFFDAELLRWLLAESFIIYGFRFLINADSKKDYLLYGLFVFIAALFHVGSLLFSVFYLVSIKNKRLLAVLIVSITLIMVVVRNTTPLYSLLSSLPFGDNLQEKYQTGFVGTNKMLFASVLRYTQVVLIAFVARYFIKGKINNGANVALSNISLSLCSKVMAINIITLFFIALGLFTPQAQRMYHAILVINYIYLAVRAEQHKYSFIGVLAATAVSLSCLFAGAYLTSEGALLVFKSHFTVGYLIRMSQMLFGG